MDQESELDLIKRATRGEGQAFRQLVETHQGLAYSIAFRFTRDEMESEDIVQNAFIKLWTSLSKYNKEFRLKTWLSKIVTNLCLDYLKSGRRKHMTDKSLSDEMPIPSQPENKLEENELKSIVYYLAEQLTEKQRAVFILRDLQMLEVEEVCQVLEMTPGNLKSNLYYARLKIKEGLQKIYKN